MSRNQNRIPSVENTEGAEPQVQSAPPIPEGANAPSPFNFIVPTEMVDLPSQGQFYPVGHPLHNADAIEIKHMTAKEEDILTSTTLLKKGVALDKMLQSVIVDNRIKVGDLLIGDKNALLIASRVFGYGEHYNVNLNCPNCNAAFEATIDLNDLDVKESLQLGKITRTENNTFTITLPKSNLNFEIRLLTSKDETTLVSNKNAGSMKLLKLITVSVNGQTDRFFVERALQSLPIMDVSVLKKAYAAVTPDVNMTQDVECTECGETSTMGVPLDAGFFWPDV
jgi:hypothetical protein